MSRAWWSGATPSRSCPTCNWWPRTAACRSPPPIWISPWSRRSAPRSTRPAPDLKRMIDRVRFAISTEETRYYLNGIYLHATEEGGVKLLRAVATDGHRLARIDIPLPGGAAALTGVIVPRKTVGELRKLL